MLFLRFVIVFLSSLQCCVCLIPYPNYASHSLLRWLWVAYIMKYIFESILSKTLKLSRILVSLIYKFDFWNKWAQISDSRCDRWVFCGNLAPSSEIKNSHSRAGRDAHLNLQDPLLIDSSLSPATYKGVHLPVAWLPLRISIVSAHLLIFRQYRCRSRSESSSLRWCTRTR